MRRLHVLLLASALTPLSAFAQYTVGKVVFQGDVPYSQQDMVAASGLKPGSPLTATTLQAAAQALSDTGAFGDIDTSVDGPVKSVTVLFKVKAPDSLLPTTFENFPWWSDDDLRTALHQQLPLFSGSVPEVGSLKESVQQKLVALLAAKNVKAEVLGMVQEPSPSEPLRSMHYVLGSPEVRLASFTVQGNVPDLTPRFQALLPKLVGKPYTSGAFGDEATLLALYRDSGYLDASLAPVTRTVRSDTPSLLLVDLSATVHPGDIYHVGSVQWADPSLAARCSGETGPQPGAVAAAHRLTTCIGALQRSYHQAGYLDAVVAATPSLQPADHLVSYSFHVTPGQVYHLHTVEVEGLSAAQRADFNRGWLLKPGDVYDAEYPGQFLLKNNGLSSLSTMSATFVLRAEPATHLVDLTIRFKPVG